MKRAIALAGLAGVGLAALLAGYYLGLDRSGEPGKPLASTTSRVPDLRPEFSLQDSDGAMRSIAEWNGRPLVINFWATWCPPCRREIPLLNALRKEYASQGFEVIGIAVDFRDDVIAYMADTPIDYPMLIGEQDGLDVARAFGMETMGFPFTIFTDSQARIVTVHVGELHRAQAEAFLLRGNVPAAIDQLQIAVRSGDGDFYELSAAEARLRELRAIDAENRKQRQQQ